jgi:hypothetical protein
MKMKLHFLGFLLVLGLAGCNSGSEGNQQAAAEQAPPQAAPPPPAATLPSVPLALLEKIYNEGTQVDYIFYNYPFTLSLTEKGSIQYSTRHIAEDPAPLLPNCKAAGRVTYQISGNIVLEGDFYFSTGCTYFVFYEKQEKKYANYMTDEGIKYFNEQIQQALKLRQQAQPGQ